MMLRNRSSNDAGRKEVKVRIPVEQHSKLHAMKDHGGQQISATVTEALTEYFDALLDTS